MEVPCIKCGTPGNVYLNLDDGQTLRCTQCDEEYTVGDVRDFVGGWLKALAWIETHPAAKKEVPK